MYISTLISSPLPPIFADHRLKGGRNSWEICCKIQNRSDHRQLGILGHKRAARGQWATWCSLTKNKVSFTHWCAHTSTHSVTKFNVWRPKLSGQTQSFSLKQNFWQQLKTSTPKDLTTGSPWESAEDSSFETILLFICFCVCQCVCMCSPIPQYGDDSIVKGISVVMSVTFSDQLWWGGCSHGLFSPLTFQLHSETSQLGNPLRWWGQDAHCCCWMKTIRFQDSCCWLLQIMKAFI